MLQNLARNKYITIDYVEDEVLVAAGIKKLLDYPEVMVRNVLHEIEETIRILNNDSPDVLLTDLKFERKFEGFRLIKKAKDKGVKVIALTGVMQPEIFAFAKRLGVNAIMDKFVAPEVIFQTLTAAIDNPEERWVNNKEFVDEGRWFVESFEKFMELKPVEKLIIQQIGAGKTTREIADELQLVERTISNYRYKLNDRLELDENRSLYEFSKLVDKIPVEEIE